MCPSKLLLSSIGKGIKFKGVSGLKPKTVSKGGEEVEVCIALLNANSINGKQSSQVLKFF
jgi:hypothetical protein